MNDTSFDENDPGFADKVGIVTGGGAPNDGIGANLVGPARAPGS